MDDKLSVSFVDEKHIPSEASPEAKGEMSVDAIPDLEKLTEHLLEILVYLEDPKIRKIVRDNETDVKMLLNNKYADTVPYGFISLLMNEETRAENADRIVRMLENMKKAKNGLVSLEAVEKDFAEEINQKYIYSKYGSKENFEQELTKMQKKKWKKRRS